MSINSGKFYDSVKMREYCDQLRATKTLFEENVTETSSGHIEFHSNEDFKGVSAKGAKKFIKGGEGKMVKFVSSLQQKSIDMIIDNICAFEEMVDSSQKAIIKYDALEKINKDFKTYYFNYKERTTSVKRIVDNLNAEFGSYAYFDYPDGKTAENAFIDFCGGEDETAGFVKACQNKLVEYDSYTNSQWKAKDFPADVVKAKNTFNDTSLALDEKTAKSEDGMFDDDGHFGANQGGPLSGFFELGFIFWSDEAMCDFVRSHNGFEKYTDKEIYEYFKELESEGCNYTAPIHAIFSAYEGKSDEFEKKYGFPMYDEDGDYNYDYLLVDYYITTNDKIYVHQKYAFESYFYEKRDYYREHMDEYKNKYGVDFCTIKEDGTVEYEPNAEIVLENEFKVHRANNESVINVVDAGSSRYGACNRMYAYTGMHGDKVTCITSEKLTEKQINNYLKNGRTVTVIVDDFDLENKNGKVCREKVDTHAMTITGIDEDGRYIVSSWGEEFYLDTKDNNDEMEIDSYTVYSVEVGEGK